MVTRSVADGSVAGGEHRRSPDGLRRMKLLATSLLGLATLVFIVARALESRHPSIVYLRVFAEASMIGALADWFAVTALFRHPLRIPIPHTAIIPNRKDEIGRGLGTFVETNFLSADVLEEKLRSTPMAEKVGVWLADPAHAALAGDQVGTVVRSVLETLRDADVQEAIEQSVAARIRATPIGPPAGRVLEIAMADGRHQQLLVVILHRLVDVLGENRAALRTRLGNESPWWVPEPLDDRVFERLFDGLRRFLDDVADDPNHELRVTFDRRIRELVVDLKTSPEMQARVAGLTEEVLAHPALREWSQSMWAEARASLLRLSADPDSRLRRHLQGTLIELGERLQHDPVLQARVDAWIVSLAVAMVEQSRGEIGDLIATTVQSWDPDESSRRIEAQVGRDLQFIRINGTVVGGLAGLLIFTVGRLVVG